jgi:hypothetical protein
MSSELLNPLGDLMTLVQKISQCVVVHITNGMLFMVQGKKKKVCWCIMYRLAVPYFV